MLRFAEEIVLLLLNEELGDITPSFSPHSLDVVLAGAVLMDLALEGRIDTDLEQLTVVDSTPLEDELLDPTLADITRATSRTTPAFWIAHAAKRGHDIHDAVLARLVKRGILDVEGDGLVFLSRRVSHSRRYPSIDGSASEEVRLRIMRVLFSEEIPDPRDIVLICLADACGIFEAILSKSERAEVQDRIDVVRKLDLIGQAVTQAVRNVEPPPTAPRPRKAIPQSPGLPLIGNALSLLSGLRAFLVKQYRTLGPIFRVRAFHRHFIVLVGPEAYRFVARDHRHFRSYETWLPFTTGLGSTHLLVGMDGAEHVRMRRAHVEHYSQKLINHRTDEAVRIMRNEIAKWPLDKAVPGKYAFQRIVMAQLGGLIVNTAPGEYADDIIFFFEMLLKINFSRQLPAWTTALPRFRRAHKQMEELARKILADHAPENRRNRPPDFIDKILELNRTDPHLMPETNFLLTMLEAFLAGLDTVSNICAFMSYELLKHPDLLAQVTAEADALFEGGIPNLNDMHRMEVTHRVAMETLRLYPLAPVVLRTVANSFEFEGYHVPAGESVLLGFTVPHLMSEYFPDPHRFDIERYTADRAEHRQAGAYAPFGVGTHRCLGSGLAEVLVTLNLATLVHDLEFLLDPPDYNMKLKYLPVVHPAPSFKLRLVRWRTGARAVRT